MSYSFCSSKGFITSTNLALLEADINAQIPDFVSFEDSNGILVINFSRELTNEERNTLCYIYTARDVPIDLCPSTLSHPCSKKILKSPSFFSILSFNFPGTHTVKNICDVKIISNSLTSETYEIRIYDVINKKVLASGSFSNGEEHYNSLDIIEEFPYYPSILEVQYKTFGKEIYLKDLSIDYNP